jgi:acyl-CoA synthetase (AMP-forming)/AMP-acid ligase II
MDSANVAWHIQQRAIERPDQTALVFPDGAGWKSWTYAELDRRASEYARGFERAGIRRGDRTLFLVKPGLEFYAMLIGLLEVGAIPTVVDPGMGLRNVLKCVAQIQPRAMVAIPLVHAVRLFVRRPFSATEVLVTHGRRFLWGGVTSDQCRIAGAEPYPMQAFDADDEAFIVFTSGSTGQPKGVSFRHGMFHGATRLMQTLGLAPGKTSLETFAPFVIFHLALGEKVVVPDMDMSRPVTADPQKIVDAIVAHTPQTVFASPVVSRKVLHYCQQHQLRLPSIETLLTGVAPIPGLLHREFRGILAPNGRVVVNYGATEALTVTRIDSPEVIDDTWPKTVRGAGNCVGRPFPEMEVRIIKILDGAIDHWTDDLALPAGEIGEIVVKGPVTSPEYKDMPDANRVAKIRDVDGAILHRMGDLGYLDNGGRLWFCGRKAHRIETERAMIPNVPPEHVYNEHPKVYRTALVGVGPRGQQRAVLCVEMEPGQTWESTVETELKALAHGTRWEGVVDRFLPHPGFPMDARHNSKIRNEDLQAWAETQLPATRG